MVISVELAQRRYGMLVSNALAAVPAWAPIGQEPLDYRRHLGDLDDDHAASPLVEVLAHHRDRWDHIDRFDDFVDLLRCSADEPEAWARLALEGGMSISISSAKHHDGWCWWDAPNSTRTLTDRGPRLDVVAAHAAACERNGLAFGLQYSLSDWGDPSAGTAEHLATCVRPQLDDVIERFQPELLWSIGTPSSSQEPREIELLLDRVRAAGSTTTDMWSDQTLEAAGAVRALRHIPRDIDDRPWILCRGVGRSLGFNSAEQEDHLLSATEIIDLYLAVLSKGGTLLLGAGVDAHGTIPELHAEPIRRAGAWIRRNAHVLDHTQPWSIWGDDQVRYLRDGDDLLGVDIAGTGRFPQLSPDVIVVHDAEAIGMSPDTQPRVSQANDGVTIDLGHSSPPVGEPIVWRFRTTRQEQPITLFPPAVDDPIDVSDLLTDPTPEAVIQLGEGRHVGHIAVPESVTLRGLGPDRTRIELRAGQTIELQRHARLEHVTVTTAATSTAKNLVTLVGESAQMLGCIVDGIVEIRADDAAIRGSQLEGVVTKGADRLCLSHCTVESVDVMTSIHLRGGGEHLIESCEIRGPGCAIHATDTTGTAVRGNTIAARHYGVRLEHTENAHVHGNQIRQTMRAVDVDAGTHAIIDGNAVFDGDSGCLVQHVGAGVEVSGNHWERCRVGLIAWDVADLHELDNQAFDLGDEAHANVTGP